MIYSNLFNRKNKVIENKFKQCKIKRNEICIDCGANIGSITEMMAIYKPTVYAFEPNPYPFQILKDKFKNNKKIHCINKGVWDKNSTMPLYFHEHSDEDEILWSTGSSLLDFKGNINKNKSVEIEIIDLIVFIKNLNVKIKILKLDVEGVEVEILNKLIDEKLNEQIEYIFVETHDHKIPELKGKTDELRQRIVTEKITNINLEWE